MNIIVDNSWADGASSSQLSTASSSQPTTFWQLKYTRCRFTRTSVVRPYAFQDHVTLFCKCFPYRLKHNKRQNTEVINSHNCTISSRKAPERQICSATHSISNSSCFSCRLTSACLTSGFFCSRCLASLTDAARCISWTVSSPRYVLRTHEPQFYHSVDVCN